MDESYYYSLNTTEVILNEIRSILKDEKDKSSLIGFLAIPSLYYSFCTDKKLQERVFLFDKSAGKEKNTIHYTHDKFDLDENLNGKFSVIVAEPQFIDESCIINNMVTISSLARTKEKGGCKTFIITVSENKKVLGENGFSNEEIKFLPSIPNLVYQYSIFKNYELSKHSGLKQENKEILNDEERELKYLDEKRFEEMKKKKFQEIKRTKLSDIESFKRLKKYKIKDVNVQFYQNKIKSIPNGDFIDAIHEKWYTNYSLLEYHHSYVQFILPYIGHQGMNYYSQALTKDEIEVFKKDEKMQERYLKSYEMMLGFYGFKLVSKETGEITRADNFEERFKAFTFHNNLRVTRILKSLNDLEFFNRFKLPLVRQLLVEILDNNYFPNSFNSLMDFWIPALDLDDQLTIKEELKENGKLEKYMEKNKILKKQRKRTKKKFLRKRTGKTSSTYSTSRFDPKKARKNLKSFMKNAKKNKGKKKDHFDDFLVM